MIGISHCKPLYPIIFPWETIISHYKRSSHCKPIIYLLYIPLYIPWYIHYTSHLSHICGPEKTQKTHNWVLTSPCLGAEKRCRQGESDRNESYNSGICMRQKKTLVLSTNILVVLFNTSFFMHMFLFYSYHCICCWI